MNPIWQQKELREFCKTKGIHIIAYSPLGAYNTIWGDNRVMECDVLNEIAKSKGKTTAQVISCLCFHLIVGSFFLSVFISLFLLKRTLTPSILITSRGMFIFLKHEWVILYQRCSM